MSFFLSRTAADRPKQTIHAAELFHENARSIAAACADASPGEVVVAVVDPDMAFAGVWTVRVGELKERVLELEAGGWSLIFSPRTEVPEIEERSLQLARLAFARWEALRRWASKNA